MLLHDRRYHRISDKKPPVEKVSNTSPAEEKSTVKPRPTTLPVYDHHFTKSTLFGPKLNHPVTLFLDFQKSPSSDLIWRWTSRDFASRPKKLALLAKKLVRSACSKSTLFFETSFTLTLCLYDLEPILTLTEVPTGHCSSSSDFMFCYASLAKAHR